MRLRTPTAILQSLQIVNKMDQVCREYFKKGKARYGDDTSPIANRVH